MIDFVRWIGAALVACALLVSGRQAHATITATYNPPTKTSQSGYQYDTQKCYLSYQAACDGAIAHGTVPAGSALNGSNYCGKSPFGFYPPMACSTACATGYTYASGTTCNKDAGTPVNVCPANSTIVNPGASATCACSSGYVESAGSCVAVNCSVGTDKKSFTWFQGWDTNRDGGVDTYPNGGNITSVPYSTFRDPSNGCAYTIDKAAPNVSCFSYASAPTKVYCSADFTQTGSAAVGSEGTTSTPDASSPCPAGQTQGTVNGIQRCASSGDVTPPPPPTTKTTTEAITDNGNGTSTKVVTTTNPDGSQSITTNIINNTTGQQQPGTTSTTVDKQATLGDGKSGETPQAEYCRDNPNAPQCKVGGFTGACATTFSCDGDAIQCAQALAAWTFACEATKTNASTTLGNQIIAGDDPLKGQVPSSTKYDTIDLNVGGTINQAGFLAHSCPGDEVFQFVGGHTVTVPWSTWCPYLEMFARLLVAACMLAAVGIIGKGA